MTRYKKRIRNCADSKQTILSRRKTNGDITLHFILFDILFDPSIEMSFSEITDQIDERLSRFSELRMFAESTVRKRL